MKIIFAFQFFVAHIIAKCCFPPVSVDCCHTWEINSTIPPKALLHLLLTFYKQLHLRCCRGPRSTSENLSCFLKSCVKSFIIHIFIQILHLLSQRFKREKSEGIYGAKYSRMNQVKFFKGCLPQILLGPFLNTLSCHRKLNKCEKSIYNKEICQKKKNMNTLPFITFPHEFRFGQNHCHV